MDYLYQLFELLKIKNYIWKSTDDNDNHFKKPDNYKNINNNSVNI